MTKRIVELKKQGVSWSELYTLIREEFEDAPSKASIRRRYYNRVSGRKVSLSPSLNGGWDIPLRNTELIEEIFTRQLRSMGLSSKEIQKELKRLIG
jgi:intein-encoded DNA endonuclease-like protein